MISTLTTGLPRRDHGAAAVGPRREAPWAGRRPRTTTPGATRTPRAGQSCCRSRSVSNRPCPGRSLTGGRWARCSSPTPVSSPTTTSSAPSSSRAATACGRTAPAVSTTRSRPPRAPARAPSSCYTATSASRSGCRSACNASPSRCSTWPLSGTTSGGRWRRCCATGSQTSSCAAVSWAASP